MPPFEQFVSDSSSNNAVTHAGVVKYWIVKNQTSLANANLEIRTVRHLAEMCQHQIQRQQAARSIVSKACDSQQIRSTSNFYSKHLISGLGTLGKIRNAI